MDALVDILARSPVEVSHIHYCLDDRGHVIVSCEIADLDQGLTYDQAEEVDQMIRDLVNMACTVLSTIPNMMSINIELAYSSYDDWLDSIGTIVTVERTADNNIKIERYDPSIMDTITTYRHVYENDLMNAMSQITLV